MRQLLKVILILTVFAFALPAFAQTATPLPSGEQAAQPPQTIGIGDTVTGTLTVDHPSQTYTLQAEAGQSISVMLTSDTFDAYLSLLDGNGSVLAENDDISGTNSGFQGFVLPAASGYSLLVESYSQHSSRSAETGDYSLAVTEQQVNRIEYSQTVNDQLSTSEPAKDYMFTGQAGDVIVAGMSATDFDSYLHLLDSTGSELISNDDSGGSLDSLIGPYTLPSTGSYVLRATSLSGDTAGSFTLSLSKTEIEALSYDTPTEVSFAPNDTVKYFTFDGTAGDLVTISGNSNASIDTNLTLSDPNNSQVASDDNGGPGLDPEIYQQILSTSGTYTVALQAVAPGTGKVTLSIKHTPPPTLDDGPQTLPFSDTQNTRAIMFTAKAGETVRLNIHVTSGQAGAPSITVTQGDMTVASASGSSVSDLNFSFSPLTDGQTVVQITDYSYTSLSYEVSLAHATE